MLFDPFSLIFDMLLDPISAHFRFAFRSAYRCDALPRYRDEVEEEVGDEVVRRVGATVHGPDHVPHLLLQVPLEG